MEIDWRPFELRPDTPRGGRELSEIFPPERLPAMREHMRRFSASFGIDPPLEQVSHLPNTRRALAIAEHARDEGKLDAFRNAAMHAHWRAQEDLEKDEVLRRCAEKAGLDPDKALTAADDPVFQRRVDDHTREGQRKGVTGIPSFFIGPYFVVGCQPYEVLEAAVLRAGGKPRAAPGGND